MAQKIFRLIAWLAVFFSLAQCAWATEAKGVLSCQGRGSGALTLGSSQRIFCTFRPTNDAALQQYRARVTRVDREAAIKGPGTMIWVAFVGPHARRSGALAGEYTATKSARWGRTVLVGGRNKSVVLIPGQDGSNVATGVAGLRLFHRGPLVGETRTR
jgi:hypothetical protein